MNDFTLDTFQTWFRQTIEFATEHDATFQSALDVLDRTYEDIDTDADYRMEPAWARLRKNEARRSVLNPARERASRVA